MSMKRFYRDVSLLSLYSRACFIWFWVCRKKDLCLYIVFMPFLVIILCKTKCISHSKNQNFIGNENNENEFFTNSGSGSRYIFRGSGQKKIHNWMIYHVVFLFISLCSVLRAPCLHRVLPPDQVNFQLLPAPRQKNVDSNFQTFTTNNTHFSPFSIMKVCLHSYCFTINLSASLLFFTL